MFAGRFTYVSKLSPIFYSHQSIGQVFFLGAFRFWLLKAPYHWRENELKELTSFKTDWGSPAGGALTHVPSLRTFNSAGRRQMVLILTREDTFHVGILSNAFKKKEEGPSLPQQ